MVEKYPVATVVVDLGGGHSNKEQGKTCQLLDGRNIMERIGNEEGAATLLLLSGQMKDTGKDMPTVRCYNRTHRRRGGRRVGVGRDVSQTGGTARQRAQLSKFDPGALLLLLSCLSGQMKDTDWLESSNGQIQSSSKKKTF